MKHVTQSHAVVPLVESKDYGSAGITFDSVNMGLLHNLSMLLAFGAITGNSILILYAGATVGATTTAIAFKYRLGSADFKTAIAAFVGPDTLGSLTDVAATGLTLTAATFDHRLVTITVDADQMPEGKPYLTAVIDATATVMNIGAIGVGVHRYPGSTPPSVV